MLGERRRGKVRSRVEQPVAAAGSPAHHVGEDGLLALDVADCSRELQDLCGQLHQESRAQPAEHCQL